MRLLLAICLVLTALCAPAWAANGRLSADESEQRAKALDVFKQGKTAYKAGDYVAALKFFRQAQAIYSHETLIILALAKTLDRSGDKERALSYYHLFLEEAPGDDPDRGETIARIAAIEKELAARPGTLLLANLPSNAEVRIDDKVVGVDHRSAVELAAGSYKVNVRAPERLPFDRQVVISPGKETKLAVVLLEPVEWSKLRRDHKWTWIAGAATAASAVTTGVLAMRGSSLRSDFDVLFDVNGRATATGRKRYGCSPTATKDEDCPKLIAEGDRLHDAIIQNDRLTYTFAIASGVFAVGTVVAWVAAPVTKDQSRSQARLLPTFDGEHRGLALSLTF